MGVDDRRSRGLAPGQAAALRGICRQQRGGTDERVVQDQGIHIGVGSGDEHRCHGVETLAHMVIDEPVQSFGGGGGLVHHDSIQLGVIGRKPHEQPDGALETLATRQQLRWREGRIEPGEEMIDRSAPQLVFRGEVVVDLRLMHASAGGNGSRGSGLETGRRKLGESGVEEVTTSHLRTRLWS